MSDDAQAVLAARINHLATAAVASLDPIDRDQRIEWCRENDAHGIRVHTTEHSDLVEFRWGNRPLLFITAADLLGDGPLQLDQVTTTAPDTVPTEWIQP